MLYVALCVALWVPSVTTFVVCGETFTPEVRGTLTGISAASGKLGAILGFHCFDYVFMKHSLGACFMICSGVSILGALLTKFGMENEEERIYRNYCVRKLAAANRRTVTILTDVTAISNLSPSFLIPQ